MKILLAALAVAAVTAAAAPAAKAPTSAWDKQWLKTSLSGDLFEVAGGKIALQHSSNSATKALAARLIRDHSKSYKEGSSLARALGITPPKSALPSMQWELKVVRSKTGSAFDVWYSSLEVYDHVQDISEANDEVSDGTNARVRDEAKKELPTLKQHLAMARRALAASQH